MVRRNFGKSSDNTMTARKYLFLSHSITCRESTHFAFV